MMDMLIWGLYGLPLLLAVGYHLYCRRRRALYSDFLLTRSIEDGMTEPPSRYPMINLEICMGGGACALACPEQAIGFINGQAHLVDPTACIGHGTCAAACPMGAISLVYGTPRRPMDIPALDDSLQTNVPGLFIAGELGGLGLIHNAHQQGVQAIRGIQSRSGSVHGEPSHGKADDWLDVVIVGAGPAGMAATLAAMDCKLRFVTLEQEGRLGGAANFYPKNKPVMTQPVVLPLVGKVPFRHTHKEQWLEFWDRIAARLILPVRYHQRVDSITRCGTGFQVTTARGRYQTHTVLLALGRRGTPRRLDVPGEDLPKVHYGLIDAQTHRGQHVLVVGGGDSAVEAAIALAQQPDTHVTLSYRGDAFNRVKSANRRLLDLSPVRVLLGSTLQQIDAQQVMVQQNGQLRTIPNHAVIICAGGVLPTGLLTDLGVRIDRKCGTP